MEKGAPTGESIDILLRRRWSPRSFSGAPVSSRDLRRIFEAARRAPSSFNEQPWRFVVARAERGDAYRRILSCVFDKNRRWAASAPILGASVARTRFSESGAENRHALHDVGLAVGQLTVQATAMGIALHQIAGFDVEAARAALSIPEDHEPVAILAIGYPGEELRPGDDAGSRRLPLESLVFEDEWSVPFGGDEDGRETPLAEDVSASDT